VPNPFRSLPAALVAVALIALGAGCGDDGDDVASTGTTAETTKDAPTTDAPTTTEAATTTTTTATTTSAAIAGGAFEEGSPEAAAANAYALVFDSTVAFDDKAPHLEEADALRETVEKYGAAAQSFSGIKLTPTAVRVTGDSAAVTYDVYFGTTKQYSSLPGTIENRDGTWVVSRDEFCGFMASARTPCAA
jgi:iron complex transport system substrate-binding protein